jgi:PKD repeat protein
VFVDASTGKVLEQYSLIHTDKKEGIARTKYSGTQTIMVDSITTGADAGKFRLIEVNRHDTTGVNIETLNAENKSSQQVFQNGGKDFLDDDNDWNNVNANYDEAATDAHWGAETTYDYFLSQHNRDSYDNKGSKLLSYVHINEKGYFNASWNGLFMVYGDGSGKPLTSLDVCGHELAHGVTGNSARLIYARESGALNESFSDIFGNAIEKVYRSNQFNWKVGEDFSALRDMSNPKAFNDPQTYKGSNWKYADRDCTPSETNDQCGVHSNSGVQNFWFYLMVDGGSGKNDKGDNYTVTGIGVEDAAKIAYRNLSVYLGQSSTYFDAAYYSIKAAADLFGDSSQAYKSTVDAWYAVGVIERPYSDTLVCDFGVESVPCNLSETIYFINKSNGGTSYLWDFGDGTTSALANPSKKYTQAGSYNVKLTITKGAETKVLERTKFINFYTNEPKTASCVNKANTPNTQLGILNFSFADINYNSESASEGQLMNFTCIRATTQAGRSLPMTITTPAGQMTYARVWIDYNNDGTFTENELAMKSDSTIENHGALVHIPADAVLNTPLRIRAISSKYGANTPDNPCATVRFGQVEEYTVVLDKVSSVKNNAFASLKIYPNPVSNQALTIEAESTMNTIQIFNQIGAKVLEMNNVQQSKVTLSNLDLAPGMYMVQVQSDDKIAVNKIVIK